MVNGFCNNCHRVWTLETAQGVCQWCGKLSTIQNQRTQALRSLKSRSTSRKRQYPVGNGNGYDKLEGEWLAYYKVASRFAYKVKAQDKEDLLHDIILTLAVAERNNGHQPFTEATMYRIASRAVAHYWYHHYKVNNGLDCQHCSTKQRHNCRDDWLYPECPKAVKLESLNKPIMDNDGNLTELGELIADDKAVDLDAWVDARTFLLSFPQRLTEIAHKLDNGEKLTETDSQYLWRYRKREQKILIPM